MRASCVDRVTLLEFGPALLRRRPVLAPCSRKRVFPNDRNTIAPQHKNKRNGSGDYNRYVYHVTLSKT